MWTTPSTPATPSRMAGDEMRKREDRTIAAFCQVVALIDGAVARVLARPDRDTPGKGGCEAILVRQDREWALEHTTFDSFPNQRQDSARLMEALEPAAAAIAASCPGWRISVAVPIGAVPTGTSWAKLKASFEQAVIQALQALPDDAKNAEADVQGRFAVRIFRRRHRLPGCFLVRDAPADQIAARAEVIVAALAAKRRQLQPYVTQGFSTVLLLDNDDIGLMEPFSAAESFRRAIAEMDLSIFTEIYLVDATEPIPWFFPVKLGARLHPLPEFDAFHEWQYRQTYERE